MVAGILEQPDLGVVFGEGADEIGGLVAEPSSTTITSAFQPRSWMQATTDSRALPMRAASL